MKQSIILLHHLNEIIKIRCLMNHKNQLRTYKIIHQILGQPQVDRKTVCLQIPLLSTITRLTRSFADENSNFAGWKAIEWQHINQSTNWKDLNSKLGKLNTVSYSKIKPEAQGIHLCHRNAATHATDNDIAGDLKRKMMQVRFPALDCSLWVCRQHTRHQVKFKISIAHTTA